MRNSLLLLLAMFAAGAVSAFAAEEPAAVPPPIGAARNGQGTVDAPAPGGATEGAVIAKSIEELTGAAAPVEAPAAQRVAPVVDWEPIVQAMQLMIDQQKLALQSMNQSRAESLATSKRESDAAVERMAKLQEALEAQRTHEAETINRMNRLVVGVAAGFAGTGFVVMILTAWFFMRTMNKVAEINANIQSQLLALPQPNQPLVGNGSGNPPGNQRLLGALEQLERRIRDLEQTTAPAGGGSDPGETAHGTLAAEAELVDLETEPAEAAPSVGALMSKGQTLLNLDDAEQALECFDAVLKKDPRNADALLKKGTALERLRRMQEALDAYDAALDQDNSLTMAYLAKGGICNRMERYAEALECYERALRVQQQGAA